MDSSYSSRETLITIDLMMTIVLRNLLTERRTPATAEASVASRRQSVGSAAPPNKAAQRLRKLLQRVAELEGSNKVSLSLLSDHSSFSIQIIGQCLTK